METGISRSELHDAFGEAVKKHDPNIVKEVLKLGLDPNDCLSFPQLRNSPLKYTLLQYVACQNKLSLKDQSLNYEIMKILLEAGADPNKNPNNLPLQSCQRFIDPPLFLVMCRTYALEYHFNDLTVEKFFEYILQTVDLLLQYNTDANMKHRSCELDYTPLDIWMNQFPNISQPKFQLLEKLLEAGADASSFLQKNFDTFIMRYGITQCENIFLIFLKYCEPFQKLSDLVLERNVLDDQQTQGSPKYPKLAEALEDYEYFVDQSIDDFFNHEDRITNLMMICQYGFIKLVKKYFKESETKTRRKIKKILNVQDSLGNTALHYTIINGSPTKIITSLLEQGANPFLVNKAGKSFFDLFYFSSTMSKDAKNMIYQTSKMKKLRNDLMIRLIDCQECFFGRLPRDVRTLIIPLI